MGFFEKNMELLSEKFPKIAENLKEYEETVDYIVTVKEGNFDYPVLKYEKGGESYFLSSPFDGGDVYEQQWCKQFDDISYDGILFCFGATRISHNKAFREKYPEFVQFIYEPSVEVFRILLKTVDFSFLTQKDLLFVKGLNDDDFAPFVSGIISVERAYTTRYVCVPGYERIFSEIYKDYAKSLKNTMSNKTLDVNVMIRFSKELTRNYRNNAKDILRGGDLCSLMGSFPEGKPGILVSAGPSLNNNIDEIKNAVGKALIVATDTAVKPLLNHGIRPDAVLTIDPSKPVILFDKEEVWDIPLITMGNGNSQVIEKHKGRKFFSVSLGEFDEIMFSKFHKALPLLETGGSVANNVFSFLRECGCNPIILVGQDLAYTNKRSHADGTFTDKMKELDVTESKYIEIEDIYGGKTVTTHDFKHYLEWFEKMIKGHPEITVIDATEGGAKIHGAELMTLKEAVSKYCVEDIDVAKYFMEAPDVFDEKEREEMEEYLLGTPEDLRVLRKKAKKAKMDYEDMLFHVRRNEFGRKLKSDLKRVGKLTEFFEEDDTLKLVKPYFFEWEQKHKFIMQKVDVDSIEGLKRMLEGGKEYMDKIIEAVDFLEDDFISMTEQLKELRKKEKQEK